MTTLDYVEIPAFATRLQAKSLATGQLKPEPKIITSLPHPTQDSISNDGPHLPPNKPLFSNLPAMLLSSALQVPANTVTNPRGTAATLMSTRDPLSIPIMTDRIEEIVTWKKGWKTTLIWMSAYAFLCFFPRLLLLLPHMILIGILLITHSTHRRTHDTVPAMPPQAGEGTVGWQANLQATQNFLRIFSDVHDAILPILHHITYSSHHSHTLLSVSLVSFFALLPVVYFIPLRPTFLVIGWAPFFLTHPFTQSSLIPLFRDLIIRPFRKVLTVKLKRLIDDDNLDDKHWRAEMKEVELWENERWSSNTREAISSIRTADETGTNHNLFSPACWSKSKLKPGERKAWTRGRDGFSGVSDNGCGDVSSNLTFSLESGWFFIETEDWRPDLEGTWMGQVGADENGWVYTNEAWLEPRPLPLEEWISQGSGAGITRRRRWTRRIYYTGVQSDLYL